MPMKFTDNAAGELAVAVTALDLQLNLGLGQGSFFPVLAAGEFAYVAVQEGSAYEVMQVTARTGDLLTVLRAQGSTTARSFPIGAIVEQRMMRVVLEKLFQITGGTITGAVAITGNLTITGAITATGSMAAVNTVTVSGNNPALVLNKSGGGRNIIQGSRIGVLRWEIEPGSGTGEVGSNAGSDFLIKRYDDAGVLLGTPMTISRATGVATFAQNLTVAGTGGVTVTGVETAGTPDITDLIKGTGGWETIKLRIVHTPGISAGLEVVVGTTTPKSFMMRNDGYLVVPALEVAGAFSAATLSAGTLNVSGVANIGSVVTPGVTATSIAVTSGVDINGSLDVAGASVLRSTVYLGGLNDFYLNYDTANNFRYVQFLSNCYVGNAPNSGNLRLNSAGLIELRGSAQHAYSPIVMEDAGNSSHAVQFQTSYSPDGASAYIEGTHAPGAWVGASVIIPSAGIAFQFRNDGKIYGPYGPMPYMADVEDIVTTRIAALVASASAQDTLIAALLARVAALEAAP